MVQPGGTVFLTTTAGRAKLHHNDIARDVPVPSYGPVMIVFSHILQGYCTVYEAMLE